MTHSAADKIKDDVNKRIIVLARVESGLARRVLSQLRKVERELLVQLMDADLTGFGRARLEGLLASARTTISRGYAGLRTDFNEQIIRLAGIESNWTAQTISSAVHTAVLVNTVSVEQAAAAASRTLFQGAPAEDWLLRQSQSFQAKFTDRVRLGVAQGESMQRITQRIKGTRAFGYSDGIFNGTREQAVALTRTAVQTVANNAREQVYEANTDIVRGTQHHSTLDGRTSPVCVARDNLRWDQQKRPLGHTHTYRVPPLHFNCRSTMLPLVASWEDLGIPASELSEATRASMDGQVPADTNYSDWLRGKSKKFQDSVLGEGKAELWRRGKITTRDLVNNDGRPLTLGQLEALK